MNRTGTTILLAICCTANGASAQATPDSLQLRNDCRLYRQVVLTGEPAPRRAEALERLGLCPDAMGIVGDWLTSLSGAADPARFAELRSEIAGVRDGALFERAFAMAEGRSATPTARVIALIIVFDQQGMSWMIDYDAMVGNGRHCVLTPASGVETRALSPLPADYFARTVALAAKLGADAGEPATVRKAAQCVSKYLTLRRTIYRHGPPPLDQ